MNIKKSKKADLERKRVLFFEIGLILTLAILFTAFEWKVSDNNSTRLNFDRELIIEEDMIGVYEKKKELVVPKPKIIMPIEIIPDNSDIPDDDINISIEDDPTVFNDLDGKDWEIKEIDKEEDIIHVFVQHLPEFPGGESALFAYLAKNVHFSQTALEVGISGTVIVSFVVWKDGNIGNIEVLRSQGAGLDEAVIQAVQRMPKWKPGIQNGKKVNVKFNLPVKFKLT